MLSIQSPLKKPRELNRPAVTSSKSLDRHAEGGLLDAALLRTAVIIPARNEASSLGMVLDDLPKVGLVIVANNGSTDETPEIAKAAGCVVATEPVPGYGRACLAGLRSLSRLSGSQPFEYVAFVDGDYSDHVHLLPLLLQPLVSDDVVDGGRSGGERPRW